MRDNVFSIAKGIAIIAMVAGHAEAPEMVTNFIYTWHMPLFFIAAGYFFTDRWLDDPWEFCRRRFKGLYVPMVKWSLVFLLLHNVWHHFGILNEQYGNWTGGVTHPYTWHEAMSRLLLIFTSMSGYDEFMAGAFWFFRGLLVASVLFLVFYRLLCGGTRLTRTQAVMVICLGAVAFTAFRVLNGGLPMRFYPNGFWRETWGIFFFGIGVLYRRFEPRIREHWALLLLYFGILVVAARFHFCGMNNGASLRDLWTLPLTGCVGFLAVHYVSGVISRRGLGLRRLLVFIGENTLYIFIFHILAFKVVSLAKIHWYGLDFTQIGCHMVIHYNHTDFFWVLYTVVGVALPLLVLQGIRYLKRVWATRTAPVAAEAEADS